VVISSVATLFFCGFTIDMGLMLVFSFHQWTSKNWKININHCAPGNHHKLADCHIEDTIDCYLKIVFHHLEWTPKEKPPHPLFLKFNGKVWSTKQTTSKNSLTKYIHIMIGDVPGLSGEMFTNKTG
jgi:hypothetical protein